LSTGGMEFFTKINFLGLFAIIFGNISLAVGALFICIFIAYIWGVKKAVKEIHSGNPRFNLRPLWAFSVKFLSPAAIIIILITLIKKIITG
ncbi:MAG: sodium-dependent transporter, partial [Candidatus Aminicenantes bacterium]|nr:sodium-dependent transporter [Candidatus Aminicenantes bacterium]